MTERLKVSDKTGRQVRLPLSRAFQIALTSIRIRFWRSIITAGGTLLGIAFLASVQTGNLIEQQLPSVMDAAQAMAARDRQIWLLVMSLAICTVGITNSMLMSVTERFREIGTMKCLGALDVFVVEMFLLESSVIGIIASFVGCAIGIALIAVSTGVSHGWDVLGGIPIGQMARIIGLSIAVGSVLTVLATIPPAIRASRMPPAVALRTDI